MSKKVEVVKILGRPVIYNHKLIEKFLKAFAGQKGGLTAAYNKIKEQKGHEKISKITVILLAKKLGIVFAMGKPTETPKMKKKAA